MLSVDEALKLVLAEVDPQPAEGVDLLRAAGRILAAPIAASHSAPPFDNSAMDGFAVRSADLLLASRESPVALVYQGEVIAGDGRAYCVEEKKTLRINTGAPLPASADAVVKIEDIERAEGSVKFFAPAAAGQNIRRAGDDFRKGARMLEAGRRLGPPQIGLLASLGVARVPVARQPRVALLTTGDELVEPGLPLAAGQIYDSTRLALDPLLNSFGADLHPLGRVGDNAEATRKKLADGFDFDVLITTGGVSMGSHDFVRPGLLGLGAREIFWQVKQRPGKPMFFARKGRTLCFGLPGNPVSVFVTTLLYVRAALLKMQGASDVSLPWSKALAAGTFRETRGLTTFSRANFADGPRSVPAKLVPASMQGSHQFSALSAAAGLVRIAEGEGDIAAGAEIDFLEFSRLF